MNNEPCNAVGIDVSKGKSTIAVMRPFGEIVVSPFEITHSSSDLKMLTNILNELDGDTRIIMEYTGKYYQPIHIFFMILDFLLALSMQNSSMILQTTRFAKSRPTKQTRLKSQITVLQTGKI